jgi:CHAT domain-containing protein
MLAVALPSTPRLSDLPLAEAELAMVSSCVPVVDSLLGPDATREHLLTRLAGHSLLHFAGHGQQDPFNQQSAAMFCHDYLEHGPVTAADIAGLHLQGAELAFLSACHTARGSAQLSDESVHLAGALQLAGFRHVIAAQWMVSDSLAPWIARQVYLGLVDESGEIAPSRAPWALQAAINAVRDRGRPPLLWASYVHIGP